jgi:hypothetical protein
MPAGSGSAAPSLDAGAAKQSGEAGGQHREDEPLPAGEAGRAGVGPLEDRHLVAEQQDLAVFLPRGAAGEGEEVEQERDELGEQGEEQRVPSWPDVTTCCLSYRGADVPDDLPHITGFRRDRP